MSDDSYERERRTAPPKFDGKDWWAWKNRFRPWASDQRLASFYFDTAVPRPTAAGPEQDRWDRQQTRAFADLVAALEPQELVEIMNEYSEQTVMQPRADSVGVRLPYRPREA